MPLRNGTFTVRSAVDDPELLAQTLRQTVVKGQPEFRVTSVETQTELIAAQTVRERLLAIWRLFLEAWRCCWRRLDCMGVLHYSVLQREKEIGIRIAVGAKAGNIARLVTMRVFCDGDRGSSCWTGTGDGFGAVMSLLCFNGVKGTDPSMLLVPAVVLLVCGLPGGAARGAAGGED